MSKKPDLIICCGMSRSGSTLQYQIVKHLVESRGFGLGYGFPSQWNPSTQRGIAVIKSEPFRPELAELTQRGKALSLSIHRDPRDVMLSLLTFYTKRAEWQGAFLPTWTTTLTLLKKAIDWHTAWSDAGARSWKYEDCCRSRISPKFIYQLAQEMKIELRNSDYQTIINLFGRKRQERRINKIDRWMDTKNSLLTRGHLGTGRSRWKTEMSLSQIQSVQRIAEQFMSRHGYGLVRYDWG